MFIRDFCIIFIIYPIFAPSILRFANAQLAKTRPNLDGVGNNEQNTQWGAAGYSFGYFPQIAQLQKKPVAFEPLTDIANNTLELVRNLPSARFVSDTCARVPGDPEPDKGPFSQNSISDLTTYWGEFIAQDLSHTLPSRDQVDIVVPPIAGQPNRTIPFIRAEFVTQTVVTVPPLLNALNVRSPKTGATGFVDASMIYGINKAALDDRRDGYKFKMVKTTLASGAIVEFPPVYSDYNKAVEFTVKNSLSDPNPLFKLGNIGGNTSPSSQALHILFIREHNRRAEEIKKENPNLSDDEVFEQARAWIGALIQKITYTEYLPVILGDSLPVYNGYNSSVDPTVDVFFASVSFRYGHSEIGPTILQPTTPVTSEVTYQLENVLMNTTLVRANGIAPFLIGMTRVTQQDPDIYTIKSLRNFLFKGNPVDLFANDIERARDFGNPSYIRARQLFGLSTPKSVSEISSNNVIAQSISTAYKDINLIDPTIGGLAEDRPPYSNVGPLFRKSIISQFTASRDGDRFWYENPGVLPTPLLAKVRNTTMRDLITLHSNLEFAALGKSMSDETVFPDVWHSKDTGRFQGSKPDGFLQILSKSTFALYSKVEGDSLKIEVQCYSAGGWCGFAFGKDMGSGEFIIGRPFTANGKIQVSVQEYKSQGYAARPQLSSSSSMTVTQKSYDPAGNVLKFQFTRPNIVSGFSTMQPSSQNILFALAPFVSTMYSETQDGWFAQHSLNRYSARVNFVTGEVIEANASEMTDAMVIHAISMMIVFVLLLPLGVYLKRYFIALKWLYAHIAVQVVGTVVSVASFVYILVVRQDRFSGSTLIKRIHSIVAFVLIGFLLITSLFGLFSRFVGFCTLDILIATNSFFVGLQLKNMSYNSRMFFKTSHRWVSRSVVVLGFGQAFLGIYQYYPLSSFTSTLPYLGWWVSFAASGVVWIILFVVGDVFVKSGVSEKMKAKKLKVELHEKSFPGSPVENPNPFVDSRFEQSSVKGLLPMYDAQPSAPASGRVSEYSMSIITDTNSWKRQQSTMQSQPPPIPPAIETIERIGPQNGDQAAIVSQRQMTWKMLDDAILSGEFLVVGAGRYIYDISSWVSSHPGGTSILNAVRGTDITNDFFNELTSFDSEGFIPKAEISDVYSPTSSAFEPSAWISRLGSVPRTPAFHSTTHSTSSRFSSLTQSPILNRIEELRRSFITKEDWKLIQKARRIHGHSKKAALKIVSLLIGELVDESGTPLPLVEPNSDAYSPFDPHEYRRYALTSKKLVSAGPGQTDSPVFLCRFSLLYPFNRRMDEPEEEFFAGQSVEIQVQLDTKTGHKIVSRYYTPVAGTLKSFDVMIKVIPNGELTPLFLKADRSLLGVKQFKIRGPFGTPLIPRAVWTKQQLPNKMRALLNVPTDDGLSQKQLTILAGWRDDHKVNKKVGKIPTEGTDNAALDVSFMLNRWTRVLFIAGGSGLAPYIQIVRDHFLPENKVVYAYSDVEPGKKDELAIRAGDGILVMKHYLDGWAHGLNVRTQEEGPFPMAATVPLCGVKEMTSAKFRLINCLSTEADLFGEDILSGAAYASTGGILKVTHVISAEGKSTNTPPDAVYQREVISGGRLDIELLEEAIAEFEGGMEPHIIVCGPASFERDVYTMLVDDIGIEHRDITMLPPNSAY
ncbi:hypothetical protein HK098_008346 [Nowakowskiella sp. JEL0407]|nr:hypothetical protein HK098_008346 [Nowakowskiella sp. JEL0407]